MDIALPVPLLMKESGSIERLMITPSLGADNVREAHGMDHVACSGLFVKVLKTFAELEEMRGVWSVWNKHPNSDIDFYSMVLRSGGEVRTPHVMVCYKGGYPEAMLIGRIEKSCIELRLGYKSLWDVPVRQLTLIYGGALGNLSAVHCRALMDEVMNTLERGQADLAFFNHLDADSEFCVAATKLPRPLSRDHVPARVVHRSMTLPASVEDVYRRLSPKVRKNIKWQARKLVNYAEGSIEIRTFSKLAELNCMMAAVERVAKKTYQRALGVGFIDDQAMRQRFRLEAESGRLRAHVLYIRGEPAAFWIGSLYRDTLHSDFMGYDPVYSKYSPGMYLIMKVIEGLIARGGKEHPAFIDFGLGDAQYKELLGDRCWRERPVYIFAPTMRGMAVNICRTLVALTDQTLKQLLIKTNLLQRAKTLWRIQAREHHSVAGKDTASANEETVA
jgi:hypothetical protein